MKPKHAPNPRRAELRALSDQLKPLVKAGMYENVNEGLRALYSEQTGQTEWNTFKGWRDAGRPVRKGERGYPVWATPRERKAGDGEAMGGDLAAVASLSGAEPTGPQWFPVAYIFHAGQVEWPAFVAVSAPKAQAGSLRVAMGLYAAVAALFVVLSPLPYALGVNAPLTTHTQEDDGSDEWQEREQARLCAIDADHCPEPCETDSECMRHCPPPADDPDCDGGPQS